MTTILTCHFHWLISSSRIQGDEFHLSFWQTNFVLVNLRGRFWRVFCTDEIPPHEFKGTSFTCLFHRLISFSWIQGDDFDVSFAQTKFLLMYSWERFWLVFFTDEIRPREFKGTSFTCRFDRLISSSWIQGGGFDVSFAQTNFVVVNSRGRFWRVFFTD